MKQKNYPCEVPECGRSVVIRSTIRSGKFKGLKACPSCKSRYDKTVKVVRKSHDKRREQRSGLPVFFETAIEELRRKPFCENCGEHINAWIHPQNNVAHILSKRNYKSVMDNDLNRVFLCSSKDSENCCHEKFDNHLQDRPSMPVFEIAMIKYRLFKDDIIEMGKERMIFENNL